MVRTDLLTVRVSPDERRVIKAVAEKLHRNESDLVRTMVVEAARHLGLDTARDTIRSDAGHEQEQPA